MVTTKQRALPISKCPICGFDRQTRRPGLTTPCQGCKKAGRRIATQDVNFILREAAKVWAADEVHYQQRIEEEAQRGNENSSKDSAAQGSGSEHGPAGSVDRRGGPHVGAVAGHRR